VDRISLDGFRKVNITVIYIKYTIVH